MSSFVCCINDTYFLSIQHRVLHMNIEVIGARFVTFTKFMLRIIKNNVKDNIKIVNFL